jgi:ElaB/YqjD/DUF883 family membrane-anchored ribosome-binding protein
MSELHDIDRRVAVLEQIARDTAAGLADIRSELRQMRTESRTELQGLRTEFRTELHEFRTELQGLRTDIREQSRELHADFRWLLRFTIGGFVGTWALLAHGLHWF